MYDYKGWFTWGPKSQHGGKLPTLQPKQNIKIWLIDIKVGS